MCDHSRQRERWVTNEDWDSCDGNSGQWEYWSESACIDLDLHRYKCTLCNEVMYYSGAAREYYETGVDRKGLFK